MSDQGFGPLHDFRLRSAYSWTNGTCPSGYYVVENLATHEDGHVAGLADITGSSHTELTMYASSDTCETKKETEVDPVLWTPGHWEIVSQGRESECRKGPDRTHRSSALRR